MADQQVEAPVIQVELFEDRATVTRRVELPDTPGRHALLIEPLTPLADERQLSFVGDEGIVVEEARVERTLVRRAVVDSAEAAELREERAALRDRLQRAESEQRRLEDRAAWADHLVHAGRRWLPHAMNEVDDPAGWLHAYRELAGSASRASLQAAEGEGALHRARQELAYVDSRLHAARQGTKTLVGRLRLQVHVRTAGALRIRYTIPCAVWRPQHRASLRNGRVHWQVGAMAWNATGEDWAGVRLVCSTARPARHAHPPVLEDDVLSTRRREREVVVEARDEEIEVAREDHGRTTDRVPGVDDGGEPRTFTAPDAVDLPSDGRPLHVHLEGWAAPAEIEWIAYPERSAQVVLCSRQVNGGSRPLLAGPVELLRDSGFVGRGEVGLVAPGEPFTIGWGSHDEIRISRRRDHEVDRARLTGHQSHRFAISLRVVHLGDEPLPLTLCERVPVSELEAVTVSAASAHPPLVDGPDRDGLCRWELALQPGAVEELSLDYTIDGSAKVNLPW